MARIDAQTRFRVLVTLLHSTTATTTTTTANGEGEEEDDTLRDKLVSFLGDSGFEWNNLKSVFIDREQEKRNYLKIKKKPNEIVPHAKDFLLSTQSAQFNTDLIWSAVLKQPEREITDALDVIMPTLSLIRVRHMVTNKISDKIDKMVSYS